MTQQVSRGPESGWVKDKKHTRTLADRFSGGHHEIAQDKVKVITKLGAGSAGNVFKARYKGEIVAVKILHAGFVEEDQEYKDFMKEIKVLTHLQHPSIVRVAGGCTKTTDEPFLVYELLEGGSFQDLFKKKQAARLRWCPHESKVMRWCMDLMAGVAHMHKHHLLHRDIKLANILLSSDLKRLKLGDFGLCRTYEGSHADASAQIHSAPQGEDGTMTGMTGTYRYMAPEIFAGAKTYTDKVDVFSAALCMWSICTGVRPFDSLSTQELAGGVMARQGGVRPPHEAVKNKELAGIIASGWVHHAHDRPSAARLHQLIEAMHDSNYTAKGTMGSVGCLPFFSKMHSSRPRTD